MSHHPPDAAQILATTNPNGLTAAEVAERERRGETNAYKPRVGRSYFDIIRENVKCCRPPRTSQIPSSGCCQFSLSQFSSQVRLFQTSYEIGEPYLSYR